MRDESVPSLFRVQSLLEKTMKRYTRVARAFRDGWRDLQLKHPTKHQTAAFICETECFPKLFTFIGYDFSFQGLQKHFPF